MIPFPNIDPEIFSFNFLGMHFALRWYAVSYILGFFCAIKLMKFFILKENLWIGNRPPLTSQQADAFLTYLIIGVILGGRLGYVLFYNFGYFMSNPLAILKIWDGGMAFHGGLGVCFAVILYCRFNSISLWSGADLIAVSSPPGLFFGRIATLLMQNYGVVLLKSHGASYSQEIERKLVKVSLDFVRGTPHSSMKPYWRGCCFLYYFFCLVCWALSNDKVSSRVVLRFAMAWRDFL